MIDEELLNKFDRIQDLPVSEEMLGAYIEGNLRGSELREVHKYLHHDPFCREICNEISNEDLINLNQLEIPILEDMDIFQNCNIVLPLIDDMQLEIDDYGVAACISYEDQSVKIMDNHDSINSDLNSNYNQIDDNSMPGNHGIDNSPNPENFEML